MIGRLRTLFTAMLVLLSAFGFRAAGKSEDFRAMSFNIRYQFPADTGKLSWEARKSGCIKAIEKYKPDVIGFQEAYPYHKADLKKELGKYVMVDRGGKPGTPDLELQNNENPVMFRGDKLELLDYGYFWLNEDQTPDRKGWDAASVRNATWVKLKYKKSGRIFFYFNVHMDHRGPNARLQSSILIVEKIKEIAGDDAVVFLGGDFNMPDSEKGIKPLQDYMKEAAHSVRKPDTAPTFNDFGRKGSKPMWLDHIMFRGAIAKSFIVVDENKYGVQYISDHYPIVADFVIR
ncbi:MAG: endonuclease/exonuclease/phosphatase family protein [Bacteroidales bacterium]|nr:endonuclease/exonuclease/phosphatase family protein [Bacteroidales bacterium]